MNDVASDVESVFYAAIELDTPAERAAYLDQACGGDTDFRRRVEKLLVAHHQAGSFLEAAPSPVPDVTTDESVIERPGTIIGPYKLLEEIGEGGFGVVFLAEQSHPVRRKVALKILKPGMDTRQVVARFEAERQALAIMDHPNIAKVFDGGVVGHVFNVPPGGHVSNVPASGHVSNVPPGGHVGNVPHGGRPYFVMELVKGLPITDHCDKNDLSLRQRLELFVPVCQAVQHAHQKGIIHRDLKPSNVLVAKHDEKPVPKVIDFGVAKALGQELTDKTLHTGMAQMIGTPLYMSPEQAGEANLDVDTRSDVYSLGVLLYELLTGTTPFEKERFKKASYEEVRRIIREEEPPRPSKRVSETWSAKGGAPSAKSGEPGAPRSTLRAPRLSRSTLRAQRFYEIDWIVMKCLEKDRNRRYETASGLALDVQRYLANEPVAAGPPGAWYRFQKFARRNRGKLAASLAFALLLATATGVSIGLAVWALRAEANTHEALQQVTGEQRKTQAALQSEIAARKQTRAVLARISHRVVEETLSRKVQLSQEDRVFLRQMLADYQAFAAEKGDSVQARVLRAEGLYRVGTIRNKLGDLADAESAFRDALDILAKLTADFPREPNYRREFAHGHDDLAALCSVTGRVKEAEAGYHAALATLATLVAEFPNEPSYRRDWAHVQGHLAVLLVETNRPQEAEAVCRSALETQGRLAADHPAVPGYRRELAFTNDTLGVALARIGRPEEGEVAIRAALELRKSLLSAEPGSRQELARSYVNLAGLLATTRQAQDAESAARAALEILAALAADFPSVPVYRQELASLYHNLGMTLKAANRRDEAVAAYRSAVEIETRLTTAFPTVNEYAAALAHSSYDLGGILRAKGLTEEAILAYRQAIDALDKVLTSVPSSAPRQSLLALALQELARLLLSKDQAGESRRLLERAITHQGLATQANPGNANYSRYLRNHYLALADANVQLGDHQGVSQAALRLPELRPGVWQEHLQAARYLATCLPMVDEDAGLQEARRKELAGAYADNALEMLRKAAALGFEDATALKTEPAFAPLRSRTDFQKLMADLEARKSGK